MLQIPGHRLFVTVFTKRRFFAREQQLGANATIVCGIDLGRYCFIAAGAVVTKDVPDYALMMGVPARQIGWMSRHGIRLPEPDADRIMICPESDYTYKEIEPGVVRCLDWDEESALPPDKAIGKISYDQLKKK